MQGNKDGLHYLNEPLLIKELRLNFNKEIVNYSLALPKDLKSIEAHFLVFLHTGAGNKDEVFRVGIKDNMGECQRWIMGHGYKQEAWSYNS